MQRGLTVAFVCFQALKWTVRKILKHSLPPFFYSYILRFTDHLDDSEIDREWTAATAERNVLLRLENSDLEVDREMDEFELHVREEVVTSTSADAVAEMTILRSLLSKGKF